VASSYLTGATFIDESIAVFVYVGCATAFGWLWLLDGGIAKEFVLFATGIRPTAFACAKACFTGLAFEWEVFIDLSITVVVFVVADFGLTGLLAGTSPPFAFGTRLLACFALAYVAL
jgi:hypothetical protein